MEELQQLADGYHVLKGLSGVINELAGEEQDEENEHEDNAEHDDDGDSKLNFYRGDPMFDNSAEEEEFMECYDSCGAPKDDAKSRRIFARHERKMTRRG
jgi:hypothetical protein